MSNLNDIISLTITKATKATSQAGFSTILIVGPNPTFAGRIQFYNTNDLSPLAVDLTLGVADPEYIAASAIAAQSPKVTLIALGREDVADVTMTETLDAINTENQNFYGLITAERDATKEVAAAAWALSNKKFYAVASADADIIDEADGVDTTSIAYILKNTSNDRVNCFTKSDAVTKYTDAAYLGKMLGYPVPGTWSGNAKTLIGESVDLLTPTQSINAHDKFCNTYEEIGEVNVVLKGFTSDGGSSDITVFIDWLEARIKENIWTKMINMDKVSYDDIGIASIESAIAQILQIAQDNGALTAHSFDSNTKERTGGWDVTVPLSADVTTNDKANRILRNVKFTAFYSGAIHSIEIQGTLVL